MENKKVLISEDQDMLKEIIGDLAAYNKALTALKTSYATLDLGELDNESFKEIMISGPSSLMDRFFDNINKDLDAAGFKKEAFRKPHLDSATDTFNGFLNTIKDLKNVNQDPYYMKRRPTLQLKDISFFDGEFQVSAMDQENITEEHCRIYLNNTMEHLLYSKLTAVRDSINDFNVAMEDIAKSYELSGLDAIDFYNINGLSSLHEFLTDDPIKEINPRSIKWVSDMIARAKAIKQKSDARAALPKVESLPYDHASIVKRNEEQRIAERSALKKSANQQ